MRDYEVTVDSSFCHYVPASGKISFHNFLQIGDPAFLTRLVIIIHCEEDKINKREVLIFSKRRSTKLLASRIVEAMFCNCCS